MKAHFKNAQPELFLLGREGKTHLTEPAAWRAATMSAGRLRGFEGVSDGQEEATRTRAEAPFARHSQEEQPCTLPRRYGIPSPRSFLIFLETSPPAPILVHKSRLWLRPAVSRNPRSAAGNGRLLDLGTKAFYERHFSPDSSAMSRHATWLTRKPPSGHDAPTGAFLR